MKNTKAKIGSGDALVLIIMALASFPAVARAHDQDQFNRKGPSFGIFSEPVMLSLRVSTVRQVQYALRERGYYKGEIDGFMGDNTQIAIQTFYVDHCHPVAPVITRWLLAQLGPGSDGKSALIRNSRHGQYPAID